MDKEVDGLTRAEGKNQFKVTSSFVYVEVMLVRSCRCWWTRRLTRRQTRWPWSTEGLVQDENRFEDTPPSNISAALLLAVWTKVSKLDKSIHCLDLKSLAKKQNNFHMKKSWTPKSDLNLTKIYFRNGKNSRFSLPYLGLQFESNLPKD